MIPAIMWIRMYNHFKKRYYEKLSGGFVWLSWFAPVIVMINMFFDIVEYISQAGIWYKLSQFFNKLVGK